MTLSERTYTLDEAKNLAVKKLLSLEQMISPIGEPTEIHRMEFRVERIDILNWLQDQDNRTKIYFSSRGGEQEIGGIGVADKIQGNDEVPYEDILGSISQRFNFLNPNIRFYGGHCFDPKNISKEWGSFGAYYFFVPQFEFVQSKNETIFAVNIAYKDITKESLEKIASILTDLNFETSLSLQKLTKPLRRSDSPDKAQWQDIFTKAQNALKHKQLEKIVLAKKTDFEFESKVKAFQLKKKLQSLTPECFHFCFQPQDGIAFLGASPERLFKRTRTHLESEAVAGTQTKNSSSDILNSPKDLKEHQYVVKSIEDTLRPFTSSLKVDAKPSVLKLKWGSHLKTNIEAELKSNAGDEDILRSIHPTPAVAGYPVQGSITFISDNEPFSRGWYAGLFGYIGQNETEFTVAIRSGLIKGNKITLYAGAGILPESSCEGEWNEIEQKMNSFLKVFE